MDLQDAYSAALKQKSELMTKIQEQMKGDVKDGKLKPDTLKAFNLAQTCFDAAVISQGKPEDSMHHYSRGCVNYGEFMACQKADRGK